MNKEDYKFEIVSIHKERSIIGDIIIEAREVNLGETFKMIYPYSSNTIIDKQYIREFFTKRADECVRARKIEGELAQFLKVGDII